MTTRFLLFILIAAILIIPRLLRAGDPPKLTIAEGTSLPLPMAGHAGGLVEGHPVVAGGSLWQGQPKTKRRLHESFVFRDDRWEPAPPLPGPLSEPAFAHSPDGLYLAGGTDGERTSRELLRLSSLKPGSNWERLTPLPEPIEAAAALIHNDTFYISCGLSAGKPSNRLWSLDLKQKNAQWVRRADLPADGRCSIAFAPINDRFYLFGGFVYPPFTEKPHIFNDAYSYSPTLDKWEIITDLDFPGYAWTATPIDDTRILFAGRVSQLSLVTDELWLLDLNDCSTSLAGRLPYTSCCMPAIQRSERTLLLPGGEPDTNRNRTPRTTTITLP